MKSKGCMKMQPFFCLYVGQICPLSASTEFFILFFSWVVQSRDCPPLKADAASGPCKAGSATAHSTACASYRNPLECGAAVWVQTGPDGFRILVSNMGVMQDFPSPFSASCILSLCCQSFLRFLPNCRTAEFPWRTKQNRAAKNLLQARQGKTEERPCPGPQAPRSARRA